jgi:hypothetical protein
MEMVGQQAVSEGFGDGHDMFGVLFQKVRVIALFDKQVFAVVAAIVDMVGLTELKRLDSHGLERNEN